MFKQTYGEKKTATCVENAESTIRVYYWLGKPYKFLEEPSHL